MFVPLFLFLLSISIASADPIPTQEDSYLLSQAFLIRVSVTPANAWFQPRPTPVHQPLPEYPIDARLHGMTGLAKLRIRIDESGKIIGMQELNSTYQIFADAAKECLAKWTFLPAKERGKPRACTMDYTFTFNLVFDHS